MNFKSYISESIPEANKNGDCYIQAYNYISNNPKVVLVHGLVHGQGALEGIIYNHAWCEDGNKIIDMTLPVKLQKSLSKDLYYAIGQIETVHKYTYEEMIEKVVEEGTYGPWDPKLKKNKY